jgi:tetratricopeptide (TPR) repeat protein
MDKKIIDVLKKIKNDHGDGIFQNKSRFNSLLMDYTKGEFKGEINLLNITLALGVFNEIKSEPREYSKIRNRYIMKLKTEYFLTEEQAIFATDIWGVVAGVVGENNINKLQATENKIDNHIPQSIEDQVNLGCDFYYGQNGKNQDYKQAIYWYTKALEKDNPSAQYYLGICHENGHGVEKDYQKAISLYTKAAIQSFQPANERLKWLKNNPVNVDDIEELTLNEIQSKLFLKNKYIIGMLTLTNKNLKFATKKSILSKGQQITIPLKKVSNVEVINPRKGTKILRFGILIGCFMALVGFMCMTLISIISSLLLFITGLLIEFLFIIKLGKRPIKLKNAFRITIPNETYIVGIDGTEIDKWVRDIKTYNVSKT